MASIGDLPPPKPPILLKDKDLVRAMALVINGVILPTNDSIFAEKGAYRLPLYARKVEGSTMVQDMSEISEVVGSSKGFFIYRDPRTTEAVRSHKLSAFGDKIYLRKGATTTLLKDVTTDGYAIAFMSVVQVKKYAYIVIGDVTMSAQCYRYDGTTGVITLHTLTAMNAAGIIGAMDDRLVSNDVADKTRALYSKLKTDGDFTDFASGTLVDDGGQLSGVIGVVKAYAYHRGLAVVFEESRISFHYIRPPIYVGGTTGTDMEKDPATIKQNSTIEDKGVANQKAVIVGRESIFFVDGSSGVFQYDTVSQRMSELTKNFQEEFLKYDLSESSICYDPIRDSLYVTASSQEGVGADSIFIYNFKAKGWSIDKGKRCNHLIYDKHEREVYGVSSIEPKMFKVFDGTYTNDSNEIEIDVYTRFYDANRRARYKEYLESSFEVGFDRDTKEFRSEIYIDNNATPQVSELIDISKKANPLAEYDATGPFGNNIASAGWFPDTSKTTFKRHFNDDPLDDFQKILQRVTEKSSSNFMVGLFEVVAQPTDDEVDTTR